MERGPILVLRAAIFIIGVIVLALCLFVLPSGLGNGWEDYRLIVAGMYVAAVPFFYALFQGLRLLGAIERGDVFTHAAVGPLRRIKFCALGISGWYAVGMPWVYHVADKGDSPGVIVVGLVIVLAAFVIATFSGVLQNVLLRAIELKSENDLTV